MQIIKNSLKELAFILRIITAIYTLVIVVIILGLLIFDVPTLIYITLDPAMDIASSIYLIVSILLVMIYWRNINTFYESNLRYNQMTNASYSFWIMAFIYFLSLGINAIIMVF